MFVKTSDIDEDGNYTADVFGETFKLSSDVNGWLLVLAGSGDLRAVRNLVESQIVVEPVQGLSLEAARRNESARFHDLLTARQHFSVEDAMELVANFTEAAGNDLEE